jgi:thiol-disulfide isomerase/thioredoxin
MRSDQPGKPTLSFSDQLMQRRSIIIGLIGTIASLATKATAETPEPVVPSFQSGGYQFTLLRPVRELPSIRLFRLDGKTIDLASLRGKPVLLNFWATWCAACRKELPILNRLHEERGRAGLYIIAVAEDSVDRATVQRYVQMLSLWSLPIFWDPNGYVAFADPNNKKNAPFALYGMPITYLIAASGQIVGYMPGAADWTSEAAGRLIEYLRNS